MNKIKHYLKVNRNTFERYLVASLFVGLGIGYLDNRYSYGITNIIDYIGLLLVFICLVICIVLIISERLNK